MEEESDEFKQEEDNEEKNVEGDEKAQEKEENEGNGLLSTLAEVEEDREG